MHGYWLNQAFNELRHPEARERMLADAAAYLDEFPLTAHEKRLVLDGDWAGCIDAGASVYTLTKVGATIGVSLLQMGAQMRSQTMAEFTTFLSEQNAAVEAFGIPLKQGGGHG